MTLDEEERHAELSELHGLLRNWRNKVLIMSKHADSVDDVLQAVARMRDEIAKG